MSVVINIDRGAGEKTEERDEEVIGLAWILWCSVRVKVFFFSAQYYIVHLGNLDTFPSGGQHSVMSVSGRYCGDKVLLLILSNTPTMTRRVPVMENRCGSDNKWHGTSLLVLHPPS